MSRIIANPIIFLLITVGILIIGYIDYLSGVEIRIFPLYFIPLVAASWYVGKVAALSLSFLVTIVWAVSMYFGGHVYSHVYIWGVNFFTQGSSFVIITLLFSSLHDAFEREYALGRTDMLTGLSNSRSFFEQASSVLSLCHRNGRPVSLAYIDLDNFKCANDTLGHLHGDDLLRKVADVFNENLRASDLVARMGGDEFVILLPETNAGDARTVLEKIRQRLGQEPNFEVCSVTVSIGAVSYSQAPSDIGPMVKSADEIMYKVKNTSKNNILVESIQ